MNSLLDITIKYYNFLQNKMDKLEKEVKLLVKRYSFVDIKYLNLKVMVSDIVDIIWADIKDGYKFKNKKENRYSFDNSFAWSEIPLILTGMGEKAIGKAWNSNEMNYFGGRFDRKMDEIRNKVFNIYLKMAK